MIRFPVKRDYLMETMRNWGHKCSERTYQSSNKSLLVEAGPGIHQISGVQIRYWLPRK